jgi:hypothetical protein
MNDQLRNFQFERNLTQQVCQFVDTPRALTVHLLVENEEYGQLLGLTTEQRYYESHRQFADDHLVTEILRKSMSMPTGIDKAGACLASFLEGEIHCRETNDRMYGDWKEPPWFNRFRANVSRILGPLSKHALQRIHSLSKHGSGASVGVSGDQLTASKKYDAIPSCTGELLPLAKAIMGEAWAEYRPELELVKGCKFFTVPKNAKTDRGCATEPLLNMMLQQGIGRYLKSRLRKFGVDISDQSINQSWASLAYDLNLATIDLSMASDLIATGLVFRVLPDEWLHLLDLARSKYMELPDGSVIELEKFSSMGNGFTFGLETLLFFALLLTVVPARDHWSCSAYGDDLICHQRYAAEVLTGLEQLGFKVNVKKSCLAGSFFESCGTDWFKSQPVRPFYLRKDETDLVPYPVSAANMLRLYSQRISSMRCCDSRWMPLWKSLVKQAPKEWRCCRTPSSLGDSGIISSISEARPRVCRKGGWEEGYLCRRIRLTPTVVDRRTRGVLFAAQARTSQEEILPEIARPTINSVGSRFMGSCVSGMRHLAWAFQRLDGNQMPTGGREPVRGLYRLARPSMVRVLDWTEGLEWC